MANYRIVIVLFLTSLLGLSELQAQNSISPQRKKAIDSLAMEKVRDLSKYISLIGDKDSPFSEANRAIERTLELFTAEAEIGVSTLSSTEVGYYLVREYLQRLMALNYDQVEITWFDIHYISDLEQQPDGRFVGVVTIYQQFTASSKEGQVVYKDTTKKDITIYVERKETQINGRMIGFWDVILGDIRVTETTA